MCLRQIIEDDVQIVFEGLSHPEVIKYYGVNYTSVEGTQEQMDWYKKIHEERTGIWWGITFRENEKKLVGACGFNNWNHKHLNAEMGYWLLPEYQKQGIMTEAITAIMDHAFSGMKLHRISAITEPENLGSIWLLEKMGFIQEGVQKEAELKNGKYIDLIQYALLNPHHT